MHIKASRFRTRASAINSREVEVSNIRDFEVGDPVCVYGAGTSEEELPSPLPPTISLSGEEEARAYRFRYLTEDKRWSRLSDEITVQPKDGIVVFDWPLEGLLEEAKWIVIYRSTRSQSLQAVGAIICHPAGRGRFEGLRIAFIDNGGDDYKSRGLPEWFPDGTADDNRHGRLRTTIADISDNTITLQDEVFEGLNRGVFAHDAGQIIQELHDNGEEIVLGPGQFQCHGDLILRDTDRSLRGQRPRRSEGRVDGATDLIFEDGAGLKIEGRRTDVENLSILQTASRALPPLDIITPMRPREGEDYWMQGASVLIVTRTFLKSVAVNRGRGSGIVVLAGAGGLTGKANLSHWSDIQSNLHLGHGFFVDGSDANASVLTGLNSVGNAGWGIVDESALGNNYIAPHTSKNALGAYRIGRDPLRTGGNRSTLVNPYSEQGQSSSLIGPFVLVLGGVWRVDEGGGHVLLGDGFRKSLTVGRSVKTTFGTHKEASNTLRKYDSDRLRHHRAVTSDTPDTSVDDYVGNTRFMSRRWHGPHSRGYGLIEFPRGVLIGESLVRSIDPENPPNGTYDIGDLCIDATGGPLLRPKERFGIGPAWAPGTRYRIGEVVIANDGRSYVCVHTENPFGDLSGEDTPDWGNIELDDQDGGVRWELWGSDRPEFH